MRSILSLALLVVPPVISGGAPATKPADPVQVTARNTAAGVVLSVRNTLPVPVTLSLSWTAQNLRSRTTSPFLFVAAAQRTAAAVALQPINPQARWTYDFKYNYQFGSHQAKHDPERAYRLPFNGSFVLEQGFNGRQSHTGLARYAVDFAMPEGTEVRAARDGIVAFTQDKFTEGGEDVKLRDRANEILIVHDDGTLAQYLHLQARGVKVTAGQAVSAGDVIGLSGSTGFTTGPHLHFMVLRPKNARAYESLPFRFADGPPQEGRTYTGN